MRHHNPRCKMLWAVLSILLACTPHATAQFEVPPPPLWQFSVRSVDETMVVILFSKHYTTPEGKGPFPISRYVIEKAYDHEFTDPVELPGPYTDVGTAYLAMDDGFTGNKRPLYRATIKDVNGVEVTSSLPYETLDQKGSVFVVSDFATDATVKCGDLLGNPCNTIEKAIDAAVAGETVYLLPGIYSGAGNTNLTFGGKAITVNSVNGNSLSMINCTDPVTGVKSRAFTFESGEGRDSVLAGVSITGGDADTGGCVSITNAAPTIRDSLFLACNASTGISRGGAIYAYGNPEPGPLISNNQFIFNWGNEGAAIYVGGQSKMEVEGCFFEWGICPTATGRGGAICADQANITVTGTIMRNGITGFGGGGIMLERGYANLNGLEVYNNTAGNFGGGFLLFGGNMKITDSTVSGNTGNVFAGGVIITSSVYESINTIHNDNYGRLGAGALKVLGGQLKLKGGEIKGNHATYGGAFDIAQQGDLSTMFTSIIVEDTVVEDNWVSDRGGGVYLDSYDEVIFKNVVFRNNTATKGGGGWCNNALIPASFINTTFEDNIAQLGGGYFVDEPCQLSFDGAIFRKNSALEAGAGIATGDGVILNITRSLFDSNGVSDCSTSKPPNLGGGIMIGVEQFEVDKQCGAITATPTKVYMKDSSFVGNIARAKGGGIMVESGILNMDNVEVQANRATGSEDGGEGIGGGIAVIERCPPGSPCSPAIAKITGSLIVDNFAHSAGGGLHFGGSNKLGGLSITKTNFTGNKVEYQMDKINPEDGVGGALFLGRSNFSLYDVYLMANEAFYGGGIFFSANLNSTGAKLSKINSNNNRAMLGPTSFWLRSASPTASLPISAFTISPSNFNGSIATEVLQTAFTSRPPSTVQSAEVVDTFSVSLVDYYGNVGLAELGTCVVAAPKGVGIAADGTPTNDTVTVRPVGSDAGVTRGGAVFSQLEVTGTIGQSYELQVDCTPNSLGRSRYLNMTGKSLPPLSLPVKLSPCAPGREPKSTGSGSICVDCPFNSFNTDGEKCLPCPEGAICAGGDQVSSEANWWRSDLQSTTFYSCRTPDVCEAGPVAGDDACATGHEGPLCAVCKEDYFTFGGKCESCDRTGQAKAMLALTCILIVVVVVLIFARSWELGTPGTPGLMTKVKILLTHFQLLALFRDYDVLWPNATGNGFSWFDTFNIGLSMMAPECFLGGAYSFWSRWIVQMVLPVGALALCGGIYYTASRILENRKARGLTEGIPNEDDDANNGQFVTSTTAAAEDGTASGSVEATSETNATKDKDKPKSKVAKMNEYLVGLKIRCWKNAFWLVTLLYPRSSMIALQMFSTQKLDIGTYLTADFSIQVKPPGGGFTQTYINYMIPGAMLLFVFAVVVPGVWFYVTWKNRHRLDDPMVAKKYGFLYGSYSRKLPFWETVEVVRKFSFAFIPVFIRPNSVGSVQGTVGQIVCLGFLLATVWLFPYAKLEDNYLQISSQVVLFLVLLSGCTAKWADISGSGLKGLAAAQLLMSSAVAFAAVSMIVLGIMHKVKDYKANKAKRASEMALNGGGDDDKNGGKKAPLDKIFNLRIFAGMRTAPDVDASEHRSDSGSVAATTAEGSVVGAEQGQETEKQSRFGGSLANKVKSWNIFNKSSGADSPVAADTTSNETNQTGANPPN